MRKYQKKQIQQIIELLEQAHEQFLLSLENKKRTESLQLLADCQDGAIAIGNMIEEAEGEGFVTVKLIEDYCEQLYVLHEMLIANADADVNESYRILGQLLMQISVSVINDIPTRLEAVFLPYKAAMWDSLESVWQAANEDPDCDAYVIPIPYYDRNPDGSFKEMHYEADLYPSDIPITKYDEYDFGKRQPDMIFIHNPYDEHNYVTSVHPFFYSKNLKQFTDCLVYIPYFATSGGFGEGQKLCSAYIYADYIVVQSEKYIDYYDEQIPREKFLPFGSPKFDSVIHKCQNPPIPPQDWLEMMAGKKVYFYNTSLSGMLADTDAFLKKMRYVFDTFKGRDDACLLWRPHPLLESTFQSMRPEYMEQFQALKDEFIQDRLGIYDTTPDIENTIALSDVYIGDAGTSVTSLFGVVGKPIFILDNYIHSLPDKDSWRGSVGYLIPDIYGNQRYHVTPGGQLWYSPNNDLHYEFYMLLDEKNGRGQYYLSACEIKGKIYIIPQNARHLLIVQNRKIIQKVAFDFKCTQSGAFCGYWYNERYIFIFPYSYPAMVRFDVETEEIVFTSGIKEFMSKIVDGEPVYGGFVKFGDELVLGRPDKNEFLFINIETLKTRLISCNFDHIKGIVKLQAEGENIWIMPVKGSGVVKWNPQTGEKHEYIDVPKDFYCRNFLTGKSCNKTPFATVIKCGENQKIISPFCGNMFLKLNEITGKMTRWNIPVEIQSEGQNDYFQSNVLAYFDANTMDVGYNRLWNKSEFTVYDVNVNTMAYKEMPIQFNYAQLMEHANGFVHQSEWMQYCCYEDAFNSLQDMINNRISGQIFDKEKAKEFFGIINACSDGLCGKKVYQFCKKNRTKEKNFEKKFG